jgi:AcrR family transcriptional regulator
VVKAPGASSASFAGPRPGGRADKFSAIMRGARTVFGRDGYARTSVESIAAEASVSTRTIYNHFEGKEQLFATVLSESATQVANGFIENVARSLTGADARTDLIVLGQAFAARRTDFPEHFAMTDQFRAEAPHLPTGIIDAWHQAGPLSVEREVTRRLQELADRGLLVLARPPRAALHFMALVSAGIGSRPYGSPPLSADEVNDAVTSGVDAFLNGYGAGPREQPGAAGPAGPAEGRV